ncbi:MAG: IclR family transcriptional regulator [Pseudomonadota bacterium]
MAEGHMKQERGSALEKALAVLESVIGQAGPVGLPDLTVQLGLPRQTIHRVLQQLESNGLLQRDAHRDRYLLGPRMMRLALESLQSLNQRGPIRGILQDLVGEIGETCNVGVLDSHEVLYIERVECDLPLRVQLHAGSHVPVHCTAIGKLLLANLSTRARQRLLSTIQLTRFTETTITDRERLEDALKAIRRDGYSVNNQEYAVGMVALAVPIEDRKGRIIAGLAVHAPHARMTAEDCIAQLPKMTAAAERLGAVWASGSDGADEPAA